MKLGVVYKNGKIINHRSLIKVLLNPILRMFGYYIGSVCKNNEIIGIKLCKGQKNNRLIFDFKYTTDYDFIDKKRRLY